MHTGTGSALVINDRNVGLHVTFAKQENRFIHQIGIVDSRQSIQSVRGGNNVLSKLFNSVTIYALRS